MYIQIAREGLMEFLPLESAVPAKAEGNDPIISLLAMSYKSRDLFYTILISFPHSLRRPLSTNRAKDAFDLPIDEDGGRLI